MYERQRILDLLDRAQDGHSLPREFYRDSDIYEFDVERLLPRTWLMVGFEAELPSPGSYFALTVGTAPILVLRGRDGEIRGFHNTCRHRGSQICPEGHGKATRLICPYHKWTYDLQGRLIGAARMGPEFNTAAHALNPIGVRLLAGCIYVSLSADAPDFDPFEKAVGPLLEDFRLRDGKVAYASVLVERANWKLAMENARECYHCATGHPDLRLTFPVGIEAGFTFGTSEHVRNYLARLKALGLSAEFVSGSWWQAGRYPLNPGIETISMDGKPLVRHRLVEHSEPEVGGFRWATEPNSFCHATSDHAFMFAAIPVAPQETLILSKWLVHKDAVEGEDYNVASLIETWTKTNMQDRDLAEVNQRGVNSLGYSPGPYSPEAEDFVIRFVDWYREAARSAALRL